MRSTTAATKWSAAGPGSCAGATSSSTWLNTTSLATRAAPSAVTSSASRTALAWQRQIRSATPSRPSERSTAQTGTPRARRAIPSTRSIPSGGRSAAGRDAVRMVAVRV